MPACISRLCIGLRRALATVWRAAGKIGMSAKNNARCRPHRRLDHRDDHAAALAATCVIADNDQADTP
jgi:hypothetical protein